MHNNEAIKDYWWLEKYFWVLIGKIHSRWLMIKSDFDDGFLFKIGAAQKRCNSRSKIIEFDCWLSMINHFVYDDHMISDPHPPLVHGTFNDHIQRTKDWNRNFQLNSQRRRSAIWSHDLQRSQWSPWSEIQYAESNDTTHDTTTTYKCRGNGLMTHSRFCFVLKPMERGSWWITASVASKKNSHFALKVRKSRHSEMNQVEKLG